VNAGAGTWRTVASYDDSTGWTVTGRAVFDADAARFDKALRAAGAIFTDADGSEWINPRMVAPGLLEAYRRFVQYGYANGLMP
jgi:hypothetical protein